MCMRCPVRAFKYGGNYSLIGGVGIMSCMSIVVVLFAILMVATCAVAFRETSRDTSDVLCFLAMLVVSVILVLVFVVKGF